MLDNYIQSRQYNYQKKIIDVKDYLSAFNIKKVVLGVSGGIDSFLVLLIMLKVKRDFLHDLEIHALHIQFDLYNKVYQKNPIEQLKLFQQSDKGFLLHVINESKSFNDIMQKMHISDDDVKSNSSYAMRYWLLFTFAQNIRGITIGTTNLDELAYVGWFGKNSDMMVDLQIISDLHKFEVYQMANMLYSSNIPMDCLHYDIQKPTGDLLSGKTDEEYFGMSYNELSLYSYLRCHGCPVKEHQQVELLHQKNKHKYLGQTFNPYFIVDKNKFFIYQKN